MLPRHTHMLPERTTGGGDAAALGRDPGHDLPPRRAAPVPRRRARDRPRGNLPGALLCNPGANLKSIS